ncbi:MAG: mechanosensitive ion channel family protein [Cyanobium sp. Prado107]|jgi:small-conductance mechanosensitive channel/CRP-like cAMP-binding protein|nr:mechanosensitive ion channel family protein [Cyanobium sp. Prado107]
MLNLHDILIAFSLGLSLLAALFICRKRRLPPIPVRLPSAAILIWLVIRSIPTQLVTAELRPWLEMAVILSCFYAILQLVVWLTLELPSVWSWWPRPAKILKDLGMLTLATIITVVVIQEQARINVVGLVTTSAILTAVIGLAAQESLKDFFAGIVLQIDSPFQEGDFITSGGEIEGWVVSLTLMSTRLQHVHGGLITLPNSRLWNADTEIHRFGPRGPIAREIHLNLDLTLPPERATELLIQVARRHPLVLRDPEPTAFVYAYADHAITYELEVWQEDPTDNGFDVLRGQLLSQIWYALERQGGRLPYPIRELRPKRLPASSTRDAAGYDAQARMNLLAQNVLFGHLSAAQLQQIAPLTRCVRFATGEAVVLEGEQGDALYQLVEGRVEVLKLIDEGVEKKVAELDPGAIFGEGSAFTGEPRSATVRALEECVLLEVERGDLRALLEENPNLVERLAKLMNDRRAHLSDLSREKKEAQVNELVQKMLQIFSTLTGSES